jgi:small subunit ribosomal protein S1
VLEIDSERRRLSLSAKRVEDQVLPLHPRTPQELAEDNAAADTGVDADLPAYDEADAEHSPAVEAGETAPLESDTTTADATAVSEGAESVDDVEPSVQADELGDGPLDGADGNGIAAAVLQPAGELAED